MAKKITWEDKEHILPYGTRENQVWDLDMNEIKTVVNANADSLAGLEGGYQGVLLIADTPINDGYYLAGESGTYTNAGSLVVDLTNTIVFINKIDTNYTLTEIDVDVPLTQTLEPANTTEAPANKAVADYIATLRGGEVASGESRDVSGDAVFDVTSKKANLVAGKNIFDKTTIVSGSRMLNDGTIGVSASFYYSDFIPVDAGQLYTSSETTRYSCYYDESFNVVVGGTNVAITQFIPPIGVSYVVITGYLTTLNSYQLEKGNTVTDYEPYNLVLPLNEAPFELVSDVEKLQTRNVIPNNIYTDDANGWEDMPVGVNSFDSIITLETETTPFNSIVRRIKAGNATSNNNFSGIAVRVGNDFKENDIIVFRGLFKKSLGTMQPYIQVRAKNESLATLLTIETNEYTEDTTDWIETGNIELTIPAFTEWIFIYIRDWTINEYIDIIGWTLTKKETKLEGVYLITDNNSKSSNVVYAVSKSGNDSNSGSISLPFLTISKAINESIGKNAKIIIGGGDYRETLDFSVLNDTENIELIAQQPELVRVMGSTALTSFAKTTGYTNIYEAPFTGTILDYSHEVGKRIFEDGRHSKEILSNEEHALQRGLTHRLPYTDIFEETFVTDLATTLTNLDANAGHFYHDVANDILYLHTSDSNDPSINSFSYEIADKPCTDTVSDLALNAKFTNINFFYGSSGFNLGNAKSIYRMACSVFGCYGNGFNDDANRVLSYKDESAGNDNDGINGHYNSVTDYLTSDIRNGSNQAYYFDAWCHDNADDGISFHERGEYQMFGGLLEYNGDRGSAPASGCNHTAYNVTARRNGQLVGVDSGAVGIGFSVVNAAVDGRNGTSANLFGCVSENNVVGYGIESSVNNKITMVNCISRNNSTVELSANYGVITSKNTLATGITLKETANGGIINVENDALLT